MDDNEEKYVKEELEERQSTVAKRLNFDSFLDSMMSADNFADEKGTISLRSADDKKSVGYKSCAKGLDLTEDSYQSSDQNSPPFKSPESSVAEESADQIIATAFAKAMQRDVPANSFGEK